MPLIDWIAIFVTEPLLDCETALANTCVGDRRITGIRLYYTHSEEGFETFWNLGLIDFRTGFIKATQITTVDSTEGNETQVVWGDHSSAATMIQLEDSSNSSIDYARYTSMPKIETFESLNGYSPYNSTLSCRYKAHCIAGRRSFIGNIFVTNADGTFRIYNDRMIVSPVNHLDTFPYPHNVLDLDISDGDEIVALSSVGDKVLQFKKNIMYVLNISTAIPSEFFVESRNRFKGANHRNHVIETSEGIFWVNNFGAYFYDGENINNLHLTGGDEEKNIRRINENKWNDFLSASSQVAFNPKTKDCFVIKDSEHTDTNDGGDCYIYNIVSDSWTYGKAKFFVGDDTKITNIINKGNDAEIVYLYDKPYSEDSNLDGTNIGVIKKPKALSTL